MDQTTLDSLLAGSRPERMGEDGLDLLAAEAAQRAVEQRTRQVSRRRTAIIAGSIAAALTLGAGAAAAAPNLAAWWLWVPDDDLVLATETNRFNGFPEVCTVRVRVLTDGKTADDSTPQRLYDARAWLQRVDPTDYHDRADEWLDGAGYSGNRDHSGIAFQQAVSVVIAEDMYALGLAGHGVSVNGDTECEPVDE